MNKSIKIFILILTTTLTFLLNNVSGVRAQDSSPAATSTQNQPSPTSDKAKQIEDLKERIATKVAQLSQTQRRAIYGSVKDVSIATATIETKVKNVKIELTDDIKVIQILKGKRTNLTTDNLSKGDLVTVFGQYDATLDILKAKVIFIESPLPAHVSGIVTGLDKVAYTVTVKNSDGTVYTIDIETFTKTSLWDGQTITKAGFSKIQIGDTVHVTGSPEKQENRISADRILDLLPLSTATRPTVTSTQPPTPSPTAKSTPSAPTP